MRYFEIIREGASTHGVKLTPEDQAGIRATTTFRDLRLTFATGHEGIVVRAIDDATGRKVGSAVFDESGGSWQVWVANSYQKRGIASRMYDFAEEQLGKPVYPATRAQLGDGKAFWDARLRKPNRFPALWQKRASTLAGQWNDVATLLHKVAQDQEDQHGGEHPRTVHARMDAEEAAQSARTWQDAADRHA